MVRLDRIDLEEAYTDSCDMDLTGIFIHALDRSYISSSGTSIKSLAVWHICG